MMAGWTIDMSYNKENNIGKITLHRGIMQGDSLSPILFILYINVVSHTLNDKICTTIVEGEELDEDGNKQQAEINHIYYVDDLKIITDDIQEAVKAYQLTKEVHEALGLTINVNKSGMTVHGDIEIPAELQELPQHNNQNPYKYLGVQTGHSVVTDGMIIQLKKKVEDTMDRINNTESSSANYITRINTQVMGLLRYSFAAIDWKITQLNELDQIIRKKMMEAKMYGKGISRHRLYVSRQQLGHGVPSARDEYAYELLRVIANYTWGNNQTMATLMQQQISTPNSMPKQILKALNKKNQQATNQRNNTEN